MKFILPLMLVLSGLVAQANAQQPSEEVERVLEATCKVRGYEGGVGSGCAFNIQNGEVHILTNYHVAGGRPTTCEFWYNGYRSVQIPAQSRWYAYQTECDLNVIAIPLSVFGDMPPPTIPLAPPGTVLYQGQTIYSAGCDDGQYPKLWKGHVTGPFGASTIAFQPMSIPGQSGSSIFARNKDGKMEIVGCIAWRSDPDAGNPDGVGVAMTISKIWEAFGTTPRTMVKNRQIAAARANQVYAVNKATRGKNYLIAGRTGVTRTAQGGSCVHGVALTDWCPSCPQNQGSQGSSCRPDGRGGYICGPQTQPAAGEYRRGFGWSFGWGGRQQAPVQPYQAPPAQPYQGSPYGQPQQPYGGQNPGYSPYPQSPPQYNQPFYPPQGSNEYVQRKDMEGFADAVDNKIEAMRNEALGQVDATNERVGKLEYYADAVKDVEGIKQAVAEASAKAEAANKQAAQLSGNINKVEEYVDATKSSLEQKVEKVDNNAAVAIENTKAGLLSKLAGKADVSEFITQYKEAREHGAAAGAEAAKEAVAARLRDRLAGIGTDDDSGGSTVLKIGQGAANALGLGAVGAGLGVLGFFLRKRPITNTIRTIRERRSGTPASSSTTVVQNPQ